MSLFKYSHTVNDVLVALSKAQQQELKDAACRGAAGLIFDGGIVWEGENRAAMIAYMEKMHGYDGYTMDFNLRQRAAMENKDANQQE